MASKVVEIDAKKFKRMLKELTAYTSAEFKDVVRIITKEILILTAQRTKKTTAKKQQARLKQKLRRPFIGTNGAKYYAGANGRLWVSPEGRNAKYNWVLMKEGVKSPPKAMPRNPPIYKSPQSKKRKLTNAERQKIRTVMTKAKEYYDSKTKYNKSVKGLSQASWLHMLRQMKVRNFGAKLKVASKIKFPSNLRRVSTLKESGSKYNFEIELYNAVQATLNRHAGGLGAFYRSLNGKIQQYEKAIAKDQKTYMKKFAYKNGFIVE